MPEFIKNLFLRTKAVSEKAIGTASLNYLLAELKILFILKSNLLDSVYPAGIVIELKNTVMPEDVIGGFWKDVTSLYSDANPNTKKWQRIIPIDSNKTNLQNTYNKYKDLEKEKYYEDSWTSFATALENAKTVLDDPEATQEQVDSTNNALLIAYIGLRLKPTS